MVGHSPLSDGFDLETRPYAYRQRPQRMERNPAIRGENRPGRVALKDEVYPPQLTGEKMRSVSWVAAMVALTFVISGFGLAGAHGISSSGPGAGTKAPILGSPARTAHPIGPVRVGSAGAPVVSSSWVSGSVIRPKAGTLAAREVSVFLKVPDATPSTDSYYNVFMSAWDNAESYDEIGFSDDYGVWGFAYVYTSACGASGVLYPDAYNLAPGVTYEFVMLVQSPSVYYYVYQGSLLVAAVSVDNGADDFVVSE